MHVLPTVSLTGYQKVLLAKIANAPESPNGGKRVHADSDKLVSAQHFLAKLKLIYLDPETELVHLSDKAEALMQEEGITDESGQLTDLGKQYAAGHIPSEKSSSGSEQDPSVPMEKFHISFKDYLILSE